MPEQPEKRIMLDHAAPLLGLRGGVGLRPAAMARARGIATSSQSKADKAGTEVALATIVEAAAAVGARIEIWAVWP